MKTIEEYAIGMVVDGATSHAEDDLNEDGAIADADHEAAVDLALRIARAIEARPADVLALARVIDVEQLASVRPTVVCLCGSTRFGEAFREANLRETVAGKIVLSIGCDLRSDHELWSDLPADEVEALKARLDELHRRKIDLADEVLVVSDASGYFGDSTRGEIAYARAQGKPVRFAVPAAEARDAEMSAAVSS